MPGAVRRCAEHSQTMSAYLGGKTYVSFPQQLSGGHGREVSLKYQIASDWKIGTSANSTGANGIEMIWHERCCAGGVPRIGVPDLRIQSDCRYFFFQFP